MASSSVRPSRLVFQLPNIGSWFENLAVTASGTILATRVDVAELWEIDPATGKGEPLVSFPAPLTAVTGIAELKDGLFAIGVGQFEGAKGTIPGSWEVWTLDLSSRATKPEPKRVVSVPPVGLLNGMATWDESRVVVADSFYGKVYLVDLAKATYAVAVEHELVALPPNAFMPYAVNGIKVATDSHGQRVLYFTNSAQLLVGRVAVGADAAPAGEAEVLARGLTCDDLALSADGESVFVTTHGSNTVVRIPVGEGSHDAVTIAGDKESLEIGGSTACAFGRRDTDKGTLYVVTAGALSMPVKGQVEPAKVVAVDVA